MAELYFADNFSVNDLPVSTRAKFALLNNVNPPYRTVGELRAAPDYMLLRIPNFGRKSFKEVREATGRKTAGLTEIMDRLKAMQDELGCILAMLNNRDVT